MRWDRGDIDFNRVLRWEKVMRFWGKGNSKRSGFVERICLGFFDIRYLCIWGRVGIGKRIM